MRAKITFSEPAAALQITHFKIYKSSREPGVYRWLDTIENAGSPYEYIDVHSDCSSYYRVAYYASGTNLTHLWSNVLPGTTNRMNQMVHRLRRSLSDFSTTIETVVDEEVGTSNGGPIPASRQTFYTAYLPIFLNSDKLKAGRWPYARCDAISAIPANTRQYDFNDEEGAFSIPSPALYPTSGTKLYASYRYEQNNYPMYSDEELKLWLKSAVDTYELWYNEGYYVSGYAEDLEVYDSAGAAPVSYMQEIFAQIAKGLITIDKAVEGTIAGGVVVREGDITVDTASGVRSASTLGTNMMRDLKKTVQELKVAAQTGKRVDIYDRTEWSETG